MSENDDDWVPPTDAEIKVLQAKRERSDKISKIMAEYLLKGYKMLSLVCPDCDTVLLQDRQQKNYCVGCSEVDNEHSKDNPALSGIAAQRQLEESQYSGAGEITHVETQTTMPSRPVSSLITTPSPPFREHPSTLVNFVSSTHNVSVGGTSPSSSQPHVANSVDHDSVSNAIQAVQEKLQWASKKLTKSNSADASHQWCNVIKACAETLLALKQAQSLSYTEARGNSFGCNISM